MIPQGPVYRELLTLMLGYFPQDIAHCHDAGDNLSSWFENGTYNVTQGSKTGFHLTASPHDLGVTTLRDVEFLVDSCFEQLFEILAPNSARQRSPAWTVVACYYYAYYSGQALSRLIGRPVIYLDTEKIKKIKEICPNEMNLGAGCFTINRIEELTVTQSAYSFKRLDSRPHDAIWNGIMGILSEILKRCEPEKNECNIESSLELQIFKYVVSNTPSRAYKNCGSNWPSEVRYEANYRVGNAYTLLRSAWDPKIGAAMDDWNDCSTQTLISTLSQAINRFNSDNSIEGLKSRVHILLNLANAIFMIVRALQSDLCDRRKTDRRWEDRRRRFCRGHSEVFEGKRGWLFPKS